MFLFWLAIGSTLPATSGWLLLALLEGKSRALFPVERATLGFLLGMTLMTFMAFFLQLLGLIRLTLLGFLAANLSLLIPLALLSFSLQRKGQPQGHPSVPSPTARPSLWVVIVLVILGIWTGTKILSSSIILVTTPTFFDDSRNNWNLRGKVYFVDQEFTLHLPGQKPTDPPSTISAYPPSVPLSKTWLAALGGEWDEGLINSIHALWYLSALLLVFFSLRRMVSAPWAFLGVYLLAGLPLYLLQGTNAYADVFLSAHVFAAVSFLFHAVRTADRDERLAFLRISILAAAILPFTKNEGLLIYLPPYIFLLLISLWWMQRKQLITRRDASLSLLLFAGALAAICIPWIGFKLAHDMPFGNAKDVSGFSIGWQPNVVYSIFINTFFEGNWLLLFPLIFTLLLIEWRAALRSPLIILSFFFLSIYGTQILLYLFTSLSSEAIMQTGYARGLIHLVPIVVLLTTVLAERAVTKRLE